MIDTMPDLQKLYNELLKNSFVQNDEKAVLFQRMQAKERYLFFIKKYPDLAKRIKQEYIASYIGITPSSLSRIKKEL